jgi:hypothetical protein
LDFVRKEIKNFARPISDLEAWLASETKAGENRWFVYYERFKEREERALMSYSAGEASSLCAAKAALITSFFDIPCLDASIFTHSSRLLGSRRLIGCPIGSGLGELNRP